MGLELCNPVGRYDKSGDRVTDTVGNSGATGGGFLYQFRDIAIVGVVVLASTATASAEQFRARYALRYADIGVGGLTTFGQIGLTTYRAGVDGEQAAYLAVLSSFRTSLRSDGAVRRGELLPRVYAATETVGGVTHKTEVKFDARNATAIDMQPPLKDANERVPVEDDHKLNVIDPGTSLLMAVRQGAETVGPAACDRTLRTFTGAHRTDLSLSYLRVERMQRAPPIQVP
jgi:hypothetical protein